MMPRRLLAILVSAALLTSWSGLALVLHLHEAGEDHNPYACHFRDGLAAGSTAVVHLPDALALDFKIERVIHAPAHLPPVVCDRGEDLVPRGPPLG